jgi:hypothetical protein
MPRPGIAAPPTRCIKTVRLSRATIIYKQDYRDLLRFYHDKGVNLTVDGMHVHPVEVHRFRIMSVDNDGRIARSTEKPKQSDSTLASMGIYVFNTQFLLLALAPQYHFEVVGPPPGHAGALTVHYWRYQPAMRSTICPSRT